MAGAVAAGPSLLGVGLSGTESRPEAVIDVHAHPYRFHSHLRHHDPSAPTFEMLRQAKVIVSGFAAVGDAGVLYWGRDRVPPFEDTAQQLRIVRDWAHQGRIKLVLGKADLPHLPPVPGSDGPPGAIMAVEGGNALEAKAANLDRLFDLGVRMITLIHFTSNDIGDPMRPPMRFRHLPKRGGLTRFGRLVVERMQDRGMIVDVAQADFRTLEGIVAVSRRPLLDSHTSPLPGGLVTSRPQRPTRLRTWAEMELVARTGGVIGLWPLAYDAGRYSRLTFEHWADEIVMIKKRLGIEHVALGTDGGGNLPRMIQGWRNILDLPKLVKAMSAAGLSPGDIRAFLWGNLGRLFKACLI
jgi:microsomal dipeptidase-like Zn-dependent dipeptidase